MKNRALVCEGCCVDESGFLVRRVKVREFARGVALCVDCREALNSSARDGLLALVHSRHEQKVLP